MSEKARRLPPVAHNDQDGAQREQLADLNANVEGNQVDKQAIGRDFEFLDFGCQTKTVEESKDERRKLRVGLNAKPALECPEVIKRFIDHGQPDNGVNKVSTDADIKEGADECPIANRLTYSPISRIL